METSVQSRYQFSHQALTTDQIGILDPTLSNPHRQLWVLIRDTQILETKIIAVAPQQYGVQILSLQVAAQGRQRGPGPWYVSDPSLLCPSLSTFLSQPFDSETSLAYATQEGVQRTLARAAELWEELLRHHQIQLNGLLQSVTENSEKKALQKSETLFQRWLQRMNTHWNTLSILALQKETWKFYQTEIRTLCSGLSTVTAPSEETPEISPSSFLISGLQPWDQRMESPPPISSHPPSSVVQTPIRLWKGLTSVHLEVQIQGKPLQGQFLIDSVAPFSILSPEWLNSKGIDPHWYPIERAPLFPVTWSDRPPDPIRLAPQVFVEKSRLSPHSLPGSLSLSSFLLFPTPLFQSPEFIGSCCDGILGIDFLKLFPIEWVLTAPKGIRMWPRVGFQKSPPYEWIEIHETSQGDLRSSCLFHSAGTEFPVEIRWATGSSLSFKIDPPAGSLTSQVFSKPELRCHSTNPRLVISLPETLRIAQTLKKRPLIQIGMPFLLSNHAIFDLPHGKLWLKTPFHYPNARPPVELEYHLEKGERILRVKSIETTSPFYRAGLRARFEITQLNEQNPADLDLWEVNQYLIHSRGAELTLQWKKKELILDSLESKDELNHLLK